MKFSILAFVIALAFSFSADAVQSSPETGVSTGSAILYAGASIAAMYGVSQFQHSNYIWSGMYVLGGLLTTPLSDGKTCDRGCQIATSTMKAGFYTLALVNAFAWGPEHTTNDQLFVNNLLANVALVGICASLKWSFANDKAQVFILPNGPSSSLALQYSF